MVQDFCLNILTLDPFGDKLFSIEEKKKYMEVSSLCEESDVAYWGE